MNDEVLISALKDRFLDYLDGWHWPAQLTSRSRFLVAGGGKVGKDGDESTLIEELDDFDGIKDAAIHADKDAWLQGLDHRDGVPKIEGASDGEKPVSGIMEPVKTIV